MATVGESTKVSVGSKLLESLLAAGADMSKMQKVLGSGTTKKEPGTKAAPKPRKTQQTAVRQAKKQIQLDQGSEIISYNLNDLTEDQREALGLNKIGKERRKKVVMPEYHVMQQKLPLESYRSDMAKALALGTAMMRLLKEGLYVKAQYHDESESVLIDWRDKVEADYEQIRYDKDNEQDMAFINQLQMQLEINKVRKETGPKAKPTLVEEETIENEADQSELIAKLQAQLGIKG